jgi:hypothetical protein
VNEDVGSEARVQLTRIEGGINLLNERLGSVKADVVDLKGSHHRLANRVGALEADNHLRKGERAGFVASGRLFQSLMGGGVLGIIALLWKAFGG